MANKFTDPKVIPFADNLAQMLPDPMHRNYGTLPDEQRAALAEDNRRWHMAEVMFEKRRHAIGVDAQKRANRDIVDGLKTMKPDAYREDMRRRLNILKGKLK